MSKFAVVTLTFLVIVGCAFWRWTPATFSIRNESGQPVRVLTVEVGGKTFQYKDIPMGGEVTGSFHVEQEEVLDVRGQFADGAEFGDACAYVVWEEFAPHVNVVVRSSGPRRVP